MIACDNYMQQTARIDPESIMVCVGDWQIQIIFAQGNQYHSQIFMYV